MLLIAVSKSFLATTNKAGVQSKTPAFGFVFILPQNIVRMNNFIHFLGQLIATQGIKKNWVSHCIIKL